MIAVLAILGMIAVLAIPGMLANYVSARYASNATFDNPGGLGCLQLLTFITNLATFSLV